MAIPTYETFVQDELSTAAVRFRSGRGMSPAVSDLAHLAWQRLRDHREYQNWLQAAAGQDVPWVYETDPGTHEPPAVGTPLLPSRAEMRAWRGNFLCFPGYPMAFMYAAWDAARQADFRRLYRQAGYTHLPLAAWGAYPGHGQYDYSRDLDGFRRLLSGLLADGIWPCLMAVTDPVGQAPTTVAGAIAWLRDALPGLRDLLPAVALGWELNMIGEWWCGNRQLILARTLRELTDPDTLIYAHFTPERITGWPDYGHTEHCPNDEVAWWRAAGDTIDGLLYQRPYDEADALTLAHTLGGDTPDGHDVGDAERIAGSYWGVGKDFVAFEMARRLDRHARLVERWSVDPRVAGWC